MQKREAERRHTTNRLKAGLLWGLLGQGGRRAVARSLSLHELSNLNEATAAFRQSSQGAKDATARAVKNLLRERPLPWVGWWVAILLVAAAAAVISFWREHPRWPVTTILSFAGPLLVAAWSPLSLRLLSPTKREALFQVRFTPGLALTIVPSFVALLWLLFWVNDAAVPARLAGIELVALLVAASLGPLLEEVVFREIIPAAPGPNLAPVGHAVSALLFALMHVPSSGSQFLYYLLAAATLSLLRMLSGGLFWPIVVHALANVVSLLVLSA